MANRFRNERIEIKLFRNLQWLLSNATNNINQIAKATNTTGVIYKNEIESMNRQIEKLSREYGRSIPCFLIKQKKVLVISMAITKIHRNCVKLRKASFL